MSDATAAPVLVASSTSTPALQGVMGVLRSLGPLGVPVHLVHPAARTPMSRSRYARSSHRAALDPSRADRYVEALLSVARRVGDDPVLVGTDDLVAQVVCDHAEALAGSFRLRVPSPDLARQLSDKRRLAALCHEHGVATPSSAVVRTLDEARAFADEVGYPVVIKAQTPDGLRMRGASVRIARSERELRDLVTRDGAVLPGTLLQQHIPGRPESVWMFNGYLDGEGRCRHAFTGQKVRQFKPNTGYTSYGVCTPNEEVERIAVGFLAAVGYRGVVDLGMRFDERTGEYLMLDVNPRLGATFRLFVGSDGTDVLRALYGDLTGRPLPPSGTLAGRTWATEPHDLGSLLLQARGGHPGLRPWLSSYRRLDETAWWSRQDPVPFFAMVGWATARALRTAARLAPTSPERTPAPLADVVAHFDAESSYWDEVYRREGVQGQTYRRRLELALEWLQELGVQRGDLVLDVGTGAGHLSAALAQRGIHVVAVDTSPAMLRHLPIRSVRPGMIAAVQGDATRLPFANGVFRAAVALGVLPWVERPERLVKELQRVCRNDGHILISADSRRRLHWALDPRYSPALRPLRHSVRPVLEGLGLPPRSAGPTPALHETWEVEQMLVEAGATPVRRAPVGYGPFTFLGLPLLGRELGTRVSTRLENAAVTSRPGLEPRSSQHLVAARARPDR